MTEEGRRLTIEKIDKYEGKAKAELTISAVLSLATITIVGLTAIEFIRTISMGESATSTWEIVTALLTAASVQGLIATISSIASLIGIQVNMNALKDMLLAEGIDYDAMTDEEKGKII